RKLLRTGECGRVDARLEVSLDDHRMADVHDERRDPQQHGGEEHHDERQDLAALVVPEASEPHSVLSITSTAGARMATKRAGKMKTTVGKSILTGALPACSSISRNRLRRASAARVVRAWASGTPSCSACRSDRTRAVISGSSSRCAMCSRAFWRLRSEEHTSELQS